MKKRRLKLWLRGRWSKDSLKKIRSNKRDLNKMINSMDATVRAIMAEKIWHFPKEANR